MSWQWTKPEDMLFTGVVHLRETGDIKHFYLGIPETTCGIRVKEFLPANEEDATVTCPNCRAHPGFFETKGDTFPL